VGTIKVSTKQGIKQMSPVQIACKLVQTEYLFAGGFDDVAFEIYEEAIALVTDDNRYEVAAALKKAGSDIEVLSSNV
jgi:hypothetical protein